MPRASSLAVAPAPEFSGPHQLHPLAASNERTLGEHLKELREFIHLTQREVSMLCDVDVSTISRWERGLHQHTHRSKDRQLRRALQALEWAAELQAQDPGRVLELEDIQRFVQRRRRGQR
jgi:transcriptional regulator with XRE-family HTH domain